MDKADNDCDGVSNCKDADCRATGYCCSLELGSDYRANEAGACTDRVDNDCDGLTNCNDPDCYVDCCVAQLKRDGVYYGTSESGYCNDQYDNDCDGRTDCSDSECRLVKGCTIIISPLGGGGLEPIAF
jgi:hypothetical protein